MNALIGYTGFVGSNLLYNFSDNIELYRSTNINDICNKSFDTIYCSGLSATKWYINKNPEEDIHSINKLIECLRTVKCNKIVVLSTVDVLDCSIEQNELTPPDNVIYAKHPYGKHHRYFEEWIIDNFKDYYIFRLPALFGDGLKKNALYDLIHNNNIHTLRKHWNFQWYNLKKLYNDIQYHIKNNNRLVHLLSEQILLDDIIKELFPTINISDASDILVDYKLSSIYPITNKTNIINDMREFIKIYNNANMLCISELGWDIDNNYIYSNYLKGININNIELVPSKYNWDYNKCKEYYNGLNIYSIQSLLYGIDIQIFKEQKKFIEHISKVVDFASNVGAKILVFGSPKQRLLSGESYIDMFRKIGDICKEKDIIFCIEHNSAKYGCNWGTTLYEVYSIVKNIDHPNIKINLDTGNMIMENEYIPNNLDISLIGHIQISFPYLEGWNNKYLDYINTIFNNIKEYSKKISLEIKYDNLHIFRDIIQFKEYIATLTY
jgi:hypothetical protein